MDQIVKKFKDKKLLNEAFTHRSFLNETADKINSNERLEFLGDAVLELLVSRYLYLKFPNFEEGKLTNLRSSIVRTETLAKASLKLGLNKKTKMSKGEEKGGGRENPTILANIFEAFLGAVYLDQGLEEARKFVDDYLFIFICEIIRNKAYLDFKSYLQEKIQERNKISPNYEVLKEEGPDHQKIFTVGVFIEGKMIGRGKGKSKQEAEERSAKQALESNGFL